MKSYRLWHLTCCLSRLVLSVLALRSILLMWSSCRSSFKQRDSAAARWLISTRNREKIRRRHVGNKKKTIAWNKTVIKVYEKVIKLLSPYIYLSIYLYSPWLQLEWALLCLSGSFWSFKSLGVISSFCRNVCEASFPSACRLRSACPFSISNLLIFSCRFLKADKITTQT